MKTIKLVFCSRVSLKASLSSRLFIFYSNFSKVEKIRYGKNNDFGTVGRSSLR